MKWVRRGLEVFGALSLLMLVVLAVLIVYSLRDKVNTAEKRDAVFILNWGGIPTNQDFKIISSYRSARNITGDHLDYYCIELPRFEVAENEKEQWHDGPETNPVLAEALQLGVDTARLHGDCFPSIDRANSEAMKIMLCSVTLHDRYPTAADIILYDSKTRRLYYVSYKT